MHFDTFVQRYNQERPHQALDMATPGSCYTPSLRPYEGLEELEYPFHDWTAVVTRCGRICYQRRKINLSQVFAGQKVGVKQTDEHIWLVSFMHYDLGYFDDETCRLEPIEDPFGPRLLPMSPEWTRKNWSGRLDSNQRPSAPKADALPGCATPRRSVKLQNEDCRFQIDCRI